MSGKYLRVIWVIIMHNCSCGISESCEINHAQILFQKQNRGAYPSKEIWKEIMNWIVL